MSRLYDAIERLEQIAEEQVTDGQAPPPEGPRPPQRPSLLRPLLFAAALILVGALVVAGIAWWRNLAPPAASSSAGTDALSLSRPSSTPAAVARQQVSAESAGAGAGVRGSVPVQESPASAPLPAEDVAQTPPGTDLASSTDKNTPAGPVPAKAGTGGRSRQGDRPGLGSGTPRPIAARPERRASVSEPDPLPAQGTSRDRPDERGQGRKKEATLARLLLQAEQRRRDQDWQGAVLLYRQVWQESGNPAVANNLAAALIRLHRYDRAIKVLEAALAISPDDRDLRDNLRLARSKRP